MLSYLESAYMKLTYGNMEPTRLLASHMICRRLWDETIKLYTRSHNWPSWMSKKEAIVTFMNSKIKESYSIPDGAIAFVNENKPHDERFHGLFYLDDPELKRHPVPVDWIIDLLPIEARTRFPEGAEL